MYETIAVKLLMNVSMSADSSELAMSISEVRIII
jgi:hypothetical protein